MDLRGMDPNTARRGPPSSVDYSGGAGRSHALFGDLAEACATLTPRWRKWDMVASSVTVTFVSTFK